MKTMQELADELQSTQILRVDVADALRDAEDQVKRLELFAVLDESINGKNAEIRAAQTQMLLEANPEWTHYREALRKGRRSLTEMDIRIEHLHWQLKAAELTIRAEIAAAAAVAA